MQSKQMSSPVLVWGSDTVPRTTQAGDRTRAGAGQENGCVTWVITEGFRRGGKSEWKPEDAEAGRYSWAEEEHSWLQKWQLQALEARGRSRHRSKSRVEGFAGRVNQGDGESGVRARAVVVRGLAGLALAGMTWCYWRKFWVEETYLIRYYKRIISWSMLSER